MTRPIVCLVTDRHRLAARASEPGDAIAAVLAQVEQAAQAGLDLVQIRERDLEGGQLFELVAECVRLTRGSRTRVLVNDRVDVALASGADGVHLRASSLEAARVREIGPAGFLIGRSVHSAAEAVAVAVRGGVDYLIVGTVFPSRSKPADGPIIGPEELERVAAAVGLPVLAIGGVTLVTIPLVARTGAAGVAAIGLFSDEVCDDRGRAMDLEAVVAEVRRLFDTSRAIP